jgi:outer membrane protein assembly factor BamB
LGTLGALAVALCCGVGLAASAPGRTSATAAPYDWPQFGGNPQHTSDNTAETILDADDVGELQKLYQIKLPSSADDAPVFLSGVLTPSGVRDLMFLSTKDGHLLAIDAQTGRTIWQQQNGPGACLFSDPTTPCFTTASPAIDPNRQYVYSYGLDGFVHKYQVGNGAEVTGAGWPELVTMKPQNEKGSGSLSVATARNGTSYLYATVSGATEPGDYQGHLTAIDLTDGSQHVFNALCSNQVDVHFVAAPGLPNCPDTEAGIWGRAGVLYEPDADRIYLAVANGPYAPSANDWGSSVLALHPDGTGNGASPLDSYTPADQDFLSETDEDVGGVTPLLLPPVPGVNVAHPALQTGKDGMLRLVNLDNLSGQGGPGNLGGEIGPILPTSQGAAPLQPVAVRSAPAIWTDPDDGSAWVFVTTGNGVAGLQLTASVTGTLALQPKWQNGCSCFFPDGNSPLVANGVLYLAADDVVEALAPTTGALLWSDASPRTVHWSSPIVANGVLYITDESQDLIAYGLPVEPLPLPPPPRGEGEIRARSGRNVLPLSLWGRGQGEGSDLQLPSLATIADSLPDLSGYLDGQAAPTQTPSWVQQFPANAPPARPSRDDAALAYDPATGSVVLFGGCCATSGFFDNDTWTWNGSTWTQQHSVAFPPGRVGAVLAYDSQLREMVLFGGYGSPCNFPTGQCTLLSDTWVWNGTTWAKLTPPTAPPARAFASLTYDTATGTLVLFGGYGAPCGSGAGGCSALGDTWTFNGSTWIQQQPAASPPARYSANLVYDPLVRSAVLFGGCCAAGQQPLGDTWLWNGSTWARQKLAAAPPARYLAGMDYDAATRSVILFGGCCDPAGNYLTGTWSWNGKTWSLLPLTLAPPPRAYANVAYDGASRSLLLFAGCCGDFSGDTWTLQ